MTGPGASATPWLLGRVGAGQLGELDRHGRLGQLRLGLRRPLELRLEAVEPAFGLRVLRLRVSEVLADEVEVVAETTEVLLQLRHVSHDLVGALLDLHPLES